MKSFVIYSKSGCLNCILAKKYLDSMFIEHEYILCDEELFDDRDGFLARIEELAGKQVTQFPMVFHDGLYLGGFQETKTFVTNLNKEFDMVLSMM